MHPSLALRPVRPDDEAFLYRVYAATREEELAPLGWDDAQKAAFLRMQFDAQRRHYRAEFPAASHDVILCDGEPAGRLIVDRDDAEIHIIDIALLPEHRGGGLGGSILRDLSAKANRAGLPLRIYVEHFNPALRLYERLGFSRIGDTGVYYHMERPPGAAGA